MLVVFGGHVLLPGAVIGRKNNLMGPPSVYSRCDDKLVAVHMSAVEQ